MHAFRDVRAVRVAHGDARAMDARGDGRARGRPRRVDVVADARAIASGRRATEGRGDGGKDLNSYLSLFKVFARRALERVVDGQGVSGEFALRACDAWISPHAFERVWGDGNDCTGGGKDGAFVRCSRASFEASLEELSARCERYVERNPTVGDANDGGVHEWMVNLTRNAGTAATDFAKASTAGTFTGEDEDGNAEEEDGGVIFIVSSLPRVTEAEARAMDASAVAKSFRGLEEQLKRERVRAHLLYVGDAPRGTFAKILRDVFQRFRGAICPLDTACHLASWAPLYSILDAMSRASTDALQETTSSTTTASVDVLVETKGSQQLRLGEAYASGTSANRGLRSMSVVGFVDRALAPSTRLATESQTILCFDDSPIRALMAMMVLKDAAAIVRMEARGSVRAAVLDPLTCSSFIVTDFATRRDGGENESVVEHAESTSVTREITQLITTRERSMTLESAHTLLAKTREDVCEQLASPNTTQPSTTQDSLALTQCVRNPLDVLTQHASQAVEKAMSGVETVLDALAADLKLGVAQSASRLESWYGLRNMTPSTCKMLHRVASENASTSVFDDSINALDARFKSMLKAHRGIVSPPRKTKARRSLTSAFALERGVKVWTGDIDASARDVYAAFVASFIERTGSFDPDTREFAHDLVARFRQSLDEAGVDPEAIVQIIDKTLAKSAKELNVTYTGASKDATRIFAKRLEYTLQMHLALQVALLKVATAREVDGTSKASREEMEERAISKTEQKKLVKRMSKLMDAIRFILTPSGAEGVRALVEAEFVPNYDALPEVLRLLQQELGVSTEPMPELRDANAVALTPFSPGPIANIRRSPRKLKPPPQELVYRAPAMPPPKPPTWHHFARSNSQRREVAVPVRVKNGFMKQPQTAPRSSGGGISRNVSGKPVVVRSTPRVGQVIGETPAMRARPGIVADTPIGALGSGLANGVPTPARAQLHTPRRIAWGTPAPKKSRFN